MSSKATDRYQQIKTVEAAPLEDGVILLDPETSQFSVLNQTATVIWAKVAEPATSEEIAAEIRLQFEEVDGGVLSEVEDTLRQMVERQLIKQV
ncbi:MAG: PqqD family protein [Candidatus Binatia bacterium]